MEQVWWQFIWWADLELVTLSKPLNWMHLSREWAWEYPRSQARRRGRSVTPGPALLLPAHVPCVMFTCALTGDPLWPLHLPSSCLSFLISKTELLVAIELTWCCGLKEWCSGLVVTVLEPRALEWARRPARGMPMRDYQDQVNRDRLGDSLDCGQPSWTDRKGENKPAPVFTSPCFLTMDATWPAHLPSLSFILPGCLALAPEKLTNTCPGICMLWCQLTVWFFVFLHKVFDLPFFPMRNSADCLRLSAQLIDSIPYPPSPAGHVTVGLGNRDEQLI